MCIEYKPNKKNIVAWLYFSVHLYLAMEGLQKSDSTTQYLLLMKREMYYSEMTAGSKHCVVCYVLYMYHPIDTFLISIDEWLIDGDSSLNLFLL